MHYNREFLGENIAICLWSSDRSMDDTVYNSFRSDSTLSSLVSVYWLNSEIVHLSSLAILASISL